MDITQLILDDHHEQRRLFALIESVDRRDKKSLTSLWKRLSAFLEVHALAEETFFYPALLKIGKGEPKAKGPEPETKDAIKDHNEIRDAIAAVEKETPGTKKWHLAVGEVNKANGDHMAEEEREGLADFRINASLQMRDALALKFAVFEADHVMGVTPVNRSPDGYIAKEKAKASQ